MSKTEEEYQEELGRLRSLAYVYSALVDEPTLLVQRANARNVTIEETHDAAWNALKKYRKEIRALELERATGK